MPQINSSERSNRADIYLAGGFYTDWRGHVRRFFESSVDIDADIVFHDPSEDTVQSAYLYEIVNREVAAIYLSDVLFAYFEETNKYPFGIFTEIGLAHGRQKRIILVDELHTRATTWLHGFCNVVTGDLEDGVKQLEKMLFTDRYGEPLLSNVKRKPD